MNSGEKKFNQKIQGKPKWYTFLILTILKKVIAMKTARAEINMDQHDNWFYLLRGNMRVQVKLAEF